MTMKEKLKIHAEIERENRENVKRWKAMELYTKLVRAGQLEEARMILRLLRNGHITLWLGDIDWNVQCALESISFPVWYSRNGNKAEARI